MAGERSRGPAWLIVAGVVSILVGIVLFVTGVVAAAREVVDELGPTFEPTHHLIGETAVPGQGPSVRLAPDDYQVVIVGDELLTTGPPARDGHREVVRLPYREPVVRVRGPDGPSTSMPPAKSAWCTGHGTWWRSASSRSPRPATTRCRPRRRATTWR